MASRKRAVLPSSAENALSESLPRDGYSYLPWVDLICAGVPCQDVSVAGKRAGLAGARTGLFYEFARILRELRPTWFLFENVPGLLSSNCGRDFAEVLRVLMVECGYGVSWRVLDSQFFGVAQRRRRLFIVGRFGKPCPPEVLFESAGGEGDLATGREARKDVAVPLTSGTGVTGNSSGRHQEDDFNIVSAPLDGTWAKGGSGKSDFPVGIVAHALSASAGHHGHSSPKGDGSDDLVTAPIVIQDARGQQEKRQNGIGITEGGPMYTMDGTSQHAVAYHENIGGNVAGAGYARALRRGASHSYQFVGDERSTVDSHGVRDFASLPEGLDSARYRALGNAVTTSVIRWIGERIIRYGD